MAQLLKHIEQSVMIADEAAPQYAPEISSVASTNSTPRSRANRFLLKARQFASPRRNKLFSDREKLFSLLFTSRPLRILFGETPELRDDMLSGFRRLRHTVEFGPMTQQSSAEYDVVVPMSLSDLAQARQFPALLRDNPIPFPPAESVSLCDDKFQLNWHLIVSGFAKHVPQMGSALEPPYILKKRIGIFGRECRVIRDLGDKAQALDQIDDPEYFCQEIVRGRREFATHILFVNGRIARSLNILYEFESDTPIKGQDPFLYRVIHRCPYLDLFTNILNSVGFQGLCCVNYKVAAGRPYILEINPRFGGSLAPYFFSFLRGMKMRQADSRMAAGQNGSAGA